MRSRRAHKSKGIRVYNKGIQTLHALCYMKMSGLGITNSRHMINCNRPLCGETEYMCNDIPGIPGVF